MRRWLLLFGFLTSIGSANALRSDEKEELILASISRVSVSAWQDKAYHYRKAVDDNIETSWGTGRAFEPKKEWIILYLEEPMYVSKVSVAIGLQTTIPNVPQGTAQSFADNGRPKDVSVYFSDGTKQDIRFDDKLGFQDRYLRPLRTRWVKLQVNDIYYGDLSDPRTQDFGIAEIKVYGTETPILEPVED